MQTSETKNRLETFRARFNQLRGDRSQEAFAKFLGISRPTVGFYENGQRLPDALVLRQIAEKCQVSADYLLGLAACKEPSNEEIHKKLGLSENAIEALIRVNDKTVKTNIGGTENYLLDSLNLLLENEERYNLLSYLSYYFFADGHDFKTSDVLVASVLSGTNHEVIGDMYFEDWVNLIALEKIKKCIEKIKDTAIRQTAAIQKEG